MSDSKTNLSINLTKNLNGYAYGVDGPFIIVDIDIAYQGLPAGKLGWPDIGRIIKGAIPDAQLPVSHATHGKFPEQFAQHLLSLTIGTLKFAGLPVFGEGKLLYLRPTGASKVQLSLALSYSTDGPNLCFETCVWWTRVLWLLCREGKTDLTKTSGGSEHRKLVQKLEKFRLSGTNTLRFLEAAYDADIPRHAIGNKYCQFGWGKNQVTTQSSILDTTPNLAVGIVRDKVSCAQFLRQAGLPGPVHRVAKTLEDAKNIAAKLGYPVVVKPADLDGGKGVFSGLPDETRLEEAWTNALEHNRPILIEKHYVGQDFRLIVIDGEMRWAVGRQPAGVTGDGQTTIAGLVEMANQDPRRGYHAAASLRPLQLDAEAKGLLDEQKCAPDTVLREGQFIHLRRAANLSSGGTPANVTEQVHPDNKALVERAVNLLELDIAGVDLIIPDIAASWLGQEAAIIEINAQPQLIAASQGHLYKEILQARLEGKGRIPIAIILEDRANGMMERLAQRLDDPQFGGIGIASAQGIFIGGQPITRAAMMRPFEAGHALLCHRDLTAMVLVINDASILKSGIPIDRFDTLVLAGEAVNGASTPEMPLDKILAMLGEHCSGEIIVHSETAPPAISEHHALTGKTISALANEAELINQVLAKCAAISGNAA